MLPPSSLVGQHARVPLLILSMGITEPLLARRAAYGRWVGARRNAGRDALTRPLYIGARGFLFSHRNTSCRHSTRVGPLTRNVKAHVRRAPSLPLTPRKPGAVHYSREPRELLV